MGHKYIAKIIYVHHVQALPHYLSLYGIFTVKAKGMEESLFLTTKLQSFTYKSE